MGKQNLTTRHPYHDLYEPYTRVDLADWLPYVPFRTARGRYWYYDGDGIVRTCCIDRPDRALDLRFGSWHYMRPYYAGSCDQRFFAVDGCGENYPICDTITATCFLEGEHVSEGVIRARGEFARRISPEYARRKNFAEQNLFFAPAQQRGKIGAYPEFIDLCISVPSRITVEEINDHLKEIVDTARAKAFARFRAISPLLYKVGASRLRKSGSMRELVITFEFRHDLVEEIKTFMPDE